MWGRRSSRAGTSYGPKHYFWRRNFPRSSCLPVEIEGVRGRATGPCHDHVKITHFTGAGPWSFRRCQGPSQMCCTSAFCASARLHVRRNFLRAGILQVVREGGVPARQLWWMRQGEFELQVRVRELG